MLARAHGGSAAGASKLGFAPSHTDHEMFELVLERLVVAVTKISHQPPGRDIGERTLERWLMASTSFTAA